MLTFVHVAVDFSRRDNPLTLLVGAFAIDPGSLGEEDQMGTVTVYDVARYILAKRGSMPHMKLQKLVYYAQAWSLVWDDAPLFHNRIEAWANGPVVRALYASLRKQFKVYPRNLEAVGDMKKLSKDQKETIDAVLKHYGSRSSQWLVELTHNEAPWKNAREGLGIGEHGQNEITHAAMVEYYSSL
jgi:uncharacterized phage-associated protein